MDEKPSEKKIGCGFLALFFFLCILAPLGLIWFLTKVGPQIVEREVARVTSPDGSFDALISVREAGEKAPKAYYVGVAEKGKIPEETGIALTIDGVEKDADLHAAWRKEKLVVTFRTGRFFKKESFVTVGNRKVDVVYE